MFSCFIVYRSIAWCLLFVMHLLVFQFNGLDFGNEFISEFRGLFWTRLTNNYEIWMEQWFESIFSSENNFQWPRNDKKKHVWFCSSSNRNWKCLNEQFNLFVHFDSCQWVAVFILHTKHRTEEWDQKWNLFIEGIIE